MKIIILIVATLIFITPSVFSQDLGKIAEANFSAAQGQALYDNGKYEEAVTPLESAIKIRPEHGRAHYYLALTYEKLGQRGKAIDFIESYLNYVKQTNEWLGSMDREYIDKCKELLDNLKESISKEETPLKDANARGN